MQILGWQDLSSSEEKQQSCGPVLPGPYPVKGGFQHHSLQLDCNKAGHEAGQAIIDDWGQAGLHKEARY